MGAILCRQSLGHFHNLTEPVLSFLDFWQDLVPQNPATSWRSSATAS